MSETPTTGPLSIECPSCGSPAGERCKAITSGRVTDTHTARITRDAGRRPPENRPTLTPQPNRPTLTFCPHGWASGNPDPCLVCGHQ